MKSSNCLPIILWYWYWTSCWTWLQPGADWGSVSSPGYVFTDQAFVVFRQGRTSWQLLSECQLLVLRRAEVAVRKTEHLPRRCLRKVTILQSQSWVWISILILACSGIFWQDRVIFISHWLLWGLNGSMKATSTVTGTQWVSKCLVMSERSYKARHTWLRNTKQERDNDTTVITTVHSCGSQPPRSPPHPNPRTDPHPPTLPRLSCVTNRTAGMMVRMLLLRLGLKSCVLCVRFTLSWTRCSGGSQLPCLKGTQAACGQDCIVRN